jgi:ParB family chromosome partitioning protein
LCGGCAERLELELELDGSRGCPACGRHRELCQLQPCTPRATRPAPAVVRAAPTGSADGTRIAWLPIEALDEPPATQNSRRWYAPASIDQLAASIAEHGLLQPLCVRPRGARYQVIFGVRRLRAARQAGLVRVPCIAQQVDDEHAFLLNVLENLHRQQLSGTERVRAIERLAATGLGVREISRRTGFNPSTISRWLRIDGRPELKQALEAGWLDMARACVLVEAPRSALGALVAEAPGLSVAELRLRVRQLKQCAGSVPSEAPHTRQHLQAALRSLQAVPQTDDREMLARIEGEVQRLLDSARSDGSRAGAAGGGR